MLAIAAAEPNPTPGVVVSTAEPCVGAPIDANGNLTSDGIRTFEWDTRNQLVAVNDGSHRSELTYDGQQRRVREIEKENGATQSDTKLVWCDGQICEERTADGITIARRAFKLGEQVAGAAHLFATDHLGSITEVTDGSGAVLGSYAFDPWGRRAVVAGSDVTRVGFTGHQRLAGLWLAPFRQYEGESGRWNSEDPVGLKAGPNRYTYVSDSPVNQKDPLGLWAGGGGVGGGYAMSVWGVIGSAADASCQFVMDGHGNMGVLCCGGGGWAGGLGANFGGQVVGQFCPKCQTICDLQGQSVQVQVSYANPGGGSGGGGYGGGSVFGSAGGRGGAGALVSVEVSKCTLVWSTTKCKCQ